MGDRLKKLSPELEASAEASRSGDALRSLELKIEISTAGNDDQICITCLTPKPLTQFAVRTYPSGQMGVRGECLACQRERYRAWYQDHKESHLKRTKAEIELKRRKKGVRPWSEKGPFFDFEGERLTIPEWLKSPKCVVNRNTLVSRIRAGWEFGRALTTPQGKQGRPRE